MWIVVDYWANDDEVGWQACNPPKFSRWLSGHAGIVAIRVFVGTAGPEQKGKRHRILDVSGLTR